MPVLKGKHLKLSAYKGTVFNAKHIWIYSDFANKLSMAILSNTNSSLQGLDLSHNLIEDRGASHLWSIYHK